MAALVIAEHDNASIKGATLNTVTAALNGGNIEVEYRGTVTYAAITSAIDNLAGYSASITAASGSTNHVAGTDANPAAANLTGGVDASGGLAQDVVFELSGLGGTEIFSFEAGTGISQLETAVDALSDSTGVTARPAHSGNCAATTTGSTGRSTPRS